MLNLRCSIYLPVPLESCAVHSVSDLQHVHSLLSAFADCMTSNYISPGTEVLGTVPNITGAAKSNFFQALMHNLRLC